MTPITAFDPQTRAITVTGQVTDDSLESLFTTGAHVLVGVIGDPRTQYVAANELGEPYLAVYSLEEQSALAGLKPGWVWKMPERVAFDARQIDVARNEKAIELSTACGLHIIGGFICDALGAPHTYPSTVLDQHNLNGLVTRSLYASNPAGWSEKFWCADSTGSWERRDHSAAQLQAVGDTAIARITAAQAQCDVLIASAMASDLAGLDAIVWVAP